MNFSRITIVSLALFAYSNIFSQDTSYVEKPDFTKTVEIAPGMKKECECFKSGDDTRYIMTTQEGFNSIDSCIVYLRQKFKVEKEEKTEEGKEGGSMSGGMSVQEYETEELTIAKYIRRGNDWIRTGYSLSDDIISTGIWHKRVDAVKNYEYLTIYREDEIGEIHPEAIATWYFPMSKY